jgi:hypothetical protein
LGTSGEGSTVRGISGILSSGRTLGFGAGVAVEDGKGGSCPIAIPARSDSVNAKVPNLIEDRVLTKSG